MGHLYLSNVKMEEYVFSTVCVKFLAKDVKISQQRSGAMFLSITMKHKGTEVNLKWFDTPTNKLDYVKPGHIYAATIKVQPYDKSPNGVGCVLDRDTIEEIFTEDLNEYIEYAEGRDRAYEVIRGTLDYLDGTVYKDIIYPLLKRRFDKFYVWTAAKSQHHNVLGGLIVHTEEVISQCIILADYWNAKYSKFDENGEKKDFINKQLLVSAALIHDLGKIDELDVDTASGATDYSIYGALSSHILDICCEIEVQAYKLQLGEQVLDNNGNPTKTEEQIIREKEQVLTLKHCLASHHGKLEYGSPVTPHLPEAEILHMMDECSAVMYKYNKKMQSIQPGNSDTVWGPGGYETTYKESIKL